MRPRISENIQVLHDALTYGMCFREVSPRLARSRTQRIVNCQDPVSDRASVSLLIPQPSASTDCVREYFLLYPTSRNSHILCGVLGCTSSSQCAAHDPHGVFSGPMDMNENRPVLTYLCSVHDCVSSSKSLCRHCQYGCAAQGSFIQHDVSG